ncbi:hypothetical protein Dsin_016463 [Dipteronia sinensis]|uniref:RNase H type-1 domain-containing protein n=1 Tax=Dipteronia sinensis TaxID=43782 RepID=A0AAE0AEE5_9ROSI|nr:hypothetical protein Dsin_016463 [Dipteronia sinensis]
MSNLASHGMKVHDYCPLYSGPGESTFHALWGCSLLNSARKDWLPIGVKVKCSHSNFFDFILECNALLTVEDLELFCTIVWKIWFLRNLVVHEAPTQNVLNVGHWCRMFLVDFHRSDEGRQISLPFPSQVINSWRPPNEEYFKINCDAAINEKEGGISLGIVIRDHSGAVMASCSLTLAAFFDANTAETMAIYRGLIFSRDCGLFPCVIESDAAAVVKWINENSHRDSISGNILAEISALVSSLHVISVSHIPRLANNVAHGLAKSALMVVEDRFWMEEFPPCVRRAVQLDMPT